MRRAHRAGAALWRSVLASRAALRGTSTCSEPLGGSLAPACALVEHGAKLRVAVALSGGVDSAVAALLLKQQGHAVFGVFMRNWDADEEAYGGDAREEEGQRGGGGRGGDGGLACWERDLRDARAVAGRLGIPLHEVDFVREYWQQVFSGFVDAYALGWTPNPDLACNRHIKFGALARAARRLGADAVATGHYARLRASPASASAGVTPRTAGASGADAAEAPAAAAPAPADEVAGVQLLRAVGRPDQSYFLASLGQRQLHRYLFPAGHLDKAQVRRLAADAGLAPAGKRSSRGICFVGPRGSFGRFMAQYCPPVPGRLVLLGAPRPGAVSPSQALSPCEDVLALTPGQRVRLGGRTTTTPPPPPPPTPSPPLPPSPPPPNRPHQPHAPPDAAAPRLYVAGKDTRARVVYVAEGARHPALAVRRALLGPISWVAGRPPPPISSPRTPPADHGDGARFAAPAGTPGNAAASCASSQPYPAARPGIAAAAARSQQVGRAPRGVPRGGGAAVESSAGAEGGEGEDVGVACECKLSYRAPAVGRCLVVPAARWGSGRAFAASRLHRPVAYPGRGAWAVGGGGAEDVEDGDGGAAMRVRHGRRGPMNGDKVEHEEEEEEVWAGGVVVFAEPAYGVAPGQALVLYDGEVVLGSAVVLAPGLTLMEEEEEAKGEEGARGARQGSPIWRAAAQSSR